MTEKRKWVPEILYEEYEEESLSSGIPFVQVPANQEMPDIIFMFGSQETGEYEPDQDGEPQPIVEMELYQYACMQYLKEDLDPVTYDKVRISLGLKPMEEASKLGMVKSKEILEKNLISEQSKL
tara:strand:- start:393 stop:764 length:372 start_codon:yes stop_codon:yes gene_type:complete